MLTWPAKDPDEVLDYTWIVPLDAGDTIATATLTKVSGSVVIDIQTSTETGLTAFMSGGTDGEVNEFRGLATSVGGRTFEETILLSIQASDSGAGFVGRFIAAFPAFAGVPAASIQFWNGQAVLITDPQADCLGARAEMATMLLTAHYLVLAGLGTGTDAQMAAQGVAGFKVIKSGSLNLERFEGSTKGGELGTTTYGARAWAMISPCFAGPRVTDTGCVVGGGFAGFLLHGGSSPGGATEEQWDETQW